MHCIFRRLQVITTLGIGLLSAHLAFAQTRSQLYGGTLDRQAQTASVRVDAGWTTYASEAAESNATGQSLRYTAGGYAGEYRTLGLFLSSTDFKIPFKLNGSEIHTTWRDLSMEYRFAWLSPRVIVAVSEVDVTKESEKITDLYGSGYGAGVSLDIPMTERIVIHVGASAIKTPKAYDKLGKDVELGMRQEGDVSASIDVIDRFVDVLVGYHYRQYTLTVEEKTMKETTSAPFGGLRVGLYF